MRWLYALRVLLSHWMRHPFQLVSLVIGLALATGLWTGVQALNTEARASYDLANDLISPPENSVLVARNLSGIPIATYTRLQNAGWRTSPVFETRIRLSGQSIDLVAVDILTANLQLDSLEQPETGDADGDLGLPDFLGREGVVLLSAETAGRLGEMAQLGRYSLSSRVPPATIVGDLSAATRFLPEQEKTIVEKGFSRLVVVDPATDSDASLEAIAPELDERLPDQRTDTGQLTDSFHLNLTAFGFLSFAVGLFVVYGTIGLSFEQRRPVFRLLRTLGLPGRELVFLAVVELLTFALFSGALGVILGYLVAAALLPEVAATIRSLYGAGVSGELAFRPQWWIAGIAIACAGTLFAAVSSLTRLYRLSPIQTGRPRTTMDQASATVRRQFFLGAALLICAVVLWTKADGLAAGFAILGCLLIGSALVFPIVLQITLKFLSSMANGPLSNWAVADTRLQLPGLSVALMALLMAISANIGVSTMVGSFRAAFDEWLDQRLVAEIYFSGRSETEADEIRDWLSLRSDAVLPIRQAETVIQNLPGRVLAMADHPTYSEHWPLLQSLDGIWDKLASGEFALINEQLSIRQDLGPGDPLTVNTGATFTIAGIYPDYGNPRSEAVINLQRFRDLFPDADKRRYIARVDPEQASGLIDEIRNRFDLPQANIADQQEVKAISKRIFERTFLVTDALNLLTLFAAGFAVLTSLITLSSIRLPQLAPLWAMGTTRRKLAWIELTRSILLAVMTAICALPVGLALGWLLLNIINVEAFGWRLPFQADPLQWLWLGALAVLAAIIASLYPAISLAGMPPAQLLRLFSNAR